MGSLSAGKRELQPNADRDDHQLVEHVENGERDCDLLLSRECGERTVAPAREGTRARNGRSAGGRSARACRCSCSSCSHVRGLMPLDSAIHTQSTTNENARNTQNDRMAPLERTCAPDVEGGGGGNQAE